MSDHIVSAYSDELERLTVDIVRMGSIVAEMIEDSCRAVSTNDLDTAKAVVARDAGVDAIEADIERQIVSIVARRQPMAHDLRLILSALKVAGELERIGDLSKNIGKRAQKLDEAVSPEMRNGIMRMATPVKRQLNNVLDAYASGSAGIAKDVWASDDEVDQHYNSLFREMLTYFMEDPRTIGVGAHMLFMAKNLERMGDHCTNIAEFVYFQATGEYLSTMERPKLPQL